MKKIIIISLIIFAVVVAIVISCINLNKGGNRDNILENETIYENDDKKNSVTRDSLFDSYSKKTEIKIVKINEETGIAEVIMFLPDISKICETVIMNVETAETTDYETLLIKTKNKIENIILSDDCPTKEKVIKNVQYNSYSPITEATEIEKAYLEEIKGLYIDIINRFERGVGDD